MRIFFYVIYLVYAAMFGLIVAAFYLPGWTPIRLDDFCIIATGFILTLIVHIMCIREGEL